MANIPEFISVLRRIRDEIYPKVEEMYENTAILKNEAEQSKNAASASASVSASSATIATIKSNEIKNVSAQANTLSNGSLATVSYNSTDGKFTFGLPVGQKGDKGESYTINAKGTTAGRAAYDTQATGFSFLDISLSIVYFKLSETSGDWSVGTSFGRGEDGEPGLDGTGIASVSFYSTTSSNGLASEPGATDTYRVTLTNASTFDYNIYNGLDYNQDLLDNKVALTGNEVIAGIKSFSSSPIVPIPTTDFQSVPLRSSNITVNVGAGQTYTTINKALEYLSGFYPMYKKGGITATINLKFGFVMNEQVLVSGIDLGWITIVGEDAETIITHTALTTAFNGTHYPAFGVDKSGTSPVMGQLFRFNVEKVGGQKHGLMAFGAGSSADFLPGKGFIGAGTYGIFAAFGSIISANSVNCSNAGDSGIHALEASTISANGANCSNAGAFGIRAGQSSTISANGAKVRNQTTGISRIRVGEGSYIDANLLDASSGTVQIFSQAVNTLTNNGIIYG